MEVLVEVIKRSEDGQEPMSITKENPLILKTIIVYMTKEELAGLPDFQIVPNINAYCEMGSTVSESMDFETMQHIFKASLKKKTTVSSPDALFRWLNKYNKILGYDVLVKGKSSKYGSEHNYAIRIMDGSELLSAGYRHNVLMTR